MAIPSNSYYGNYVSANAAADLFSARNAGSIRYDGDVRTINGFNVDVTGTNSRSETRVTTKVEHPPGVFRHKAQQASEAMAPSTLKSLLQTQDVALDRGQIDAFLDPVANEFRERLTSLPDTVEMIAVEEVPLEQIGVLGRLPASDAERAAATRERITHIGDLSRVEQEISDEMGVEVKLAYDSVAGEYVALKPGQAGYDQFLGARDLMRTMKSDIAKGGENPRDFADLLAEYGVKV